MTARHLEQSDFHWPIGLYESAPFVYIAAGLWANFRLDGPVATIASAFLILAGLGVLCLRWTYRRVASTAETDEVAPPPATAAAGEPPAGTLGPAQFPSSQGLVAAAYRGDRELVDSLIREVLARLEARYRLQEDILRSSGPAATKARWREHRALSAKISALQRGYIAGKVDRQALIECIVYDTLVDRTAGEPSGQHRAFLA